MFKLYWKVVNYCNGIVNYSLFLFNISEQLKLYIRDIKVSPCFQSIGAIAQAYQNILKVEIAYTIKISLPLATMILVFTRS